MIIYYSLSLLTILVLSLLISSWVASCRLFSGSSAWSFSYFLFDLRPRNGARIDSAPGAILPGRKSTLSEKYEIFSPYPLNYELEKVINDVTEISDCHILVKPCYNAQSAWLFFFCKVYLLVVFVGRSCNRKHKYFSCTAIHYR